MLRFITTILISLFAMTANAIGIDSVNLECKTFWNGTLNERLTISFRLKVDGEAGLPGIVYVAMANESQKIGYFFTAPADWERYTGGQLPMFHVVRSGLQDIEIVLEMGDRFKPYLGYQLYAGYGALTDEMEQKVVRRREGLNRVKAKFPSRQFPDPGDDWVRRSLVEKDLRDTKRYLPVTTISCPLNRFGGFIQ